MMKESGLEEALGTVYGQNAVTHMILGKAVSRALRGHFLVQAALFNKLMLAVLPSGLCQENVQMEHSAGEDIDFDACNEDPMSEVALAKDKLDFDDMHKIYMKEFKTIPYNLLMSMNQRNC